ncbi:hypothetical protein L211DRAFT_176837 [Terfezia boudieri ATCC MYA-4762]|uniref:Uncharacterized protein n=1 Tax=Terfezia boudieri ATCC MYA-4762 TaxID=1051890 RepID=A0A3N4LNT0_9PEZI|nr:hypothetical protein L211DRAFT_176837 [Terfezia boudieri ATCC MYA-4762]
MFSTEGFFAKANAWLREHRPLIFRPPLASECLDLNFPGIKIHHPWWYTKQDADLMVDLWLRKFGLQNTIFRNHILRLLARSHQILQDLEGDWKHEPDPAKREIILNWRREEFIKLQEEAVCEWQPDYCEWKEGRGYVPSVEGNEGGKDKEVPKSTITPTRQSTGEADEVGSEQEHTGAPQTHMPNTEGERHTVAQNVLSALRTKTESGSVERDDEQNVLEIEHGKSTSESTAEAKSGEPVKSPKSLLKGEVNDSLELSDREDDDVFSDMSGSRYWGLR